MKLQTTTTLPLLPTLVRLLETELDQVVTVSGEGLILNFRDPQYSAESGGFHPVEMALDASGRLLYITDFAYVGAGPYAELCKELDFDFSCGVFQHRGRDYPLEEGAELFSIWQGNFCESVSWGVFKATHSVL